MHTAGYVHGDLLPRNVLFGKKNSGFLIDFDLLRKENKPYVRGFNFADFEDFRHPDAKPCKQMKKIHDVHSLYQISHYFFDLSKKPIQEGITLKGLIAHFKANEKLPVNAVEESKDSSGSPNR
ncbi:unnamed protein product [Cylindrotheca closterium]|uniref:Protein kinase domain-containing protein n=1 Tax=Cylindrotheca closterium TaxID=2856 RepID=A0AAD2FKX9_9STRA|nr:unnamed protein product [Cylindrotheca closterium]